MIRARDVAVSIGGVPALRPISFDVHEGERVAIVGPNGCGKSTLLRALAGLVPTTGGTIVGVPPPGRTVLVHQRPHLFRGTVIANVRLAARAAHRASPGELDLLVRLGIDRLAERDVAALSGGERRRVAIARALARQPQVLLLDEPMADLDERARAAVERVLVEFSGTILVATPQVPPKFVGRTVEMVGASVPETKARSGADGLDPTRATTSDAAPIDPPRGSPR